MTLKLGIIGGASSYTPRVVKGLIERQGDVPVRRITLMDPNRERLEVIASLVRILCCEGGVKTEVETTSEAERAIDGADFLISQVRIGGLAARTRDERTPLDFDMIGNETVGAGGFVSALRILPYAVELAAMVERLSPQTVIINFTNPSGIVTEAVLKHTAARIVGLCNIPTDLRIGFSEYLKVGLERVTLDYFGLNHLAWVRKVYLDGEDVLPGLIAESTAPEKGLYRRGLVDRLIPPALLHTWGMVPNWDVRFYCCPDTILAEQKKAATVRDERDVEIEARLLEMYAAGEFGPEAEQLLDKKGGTHYAEAALDVMESMVLDKGARLVLDVRNGGALPELPSDVCVEVPAIVRRSGIEPLPIGPMPLAVRGLVQAVKAHEEITVEAALTGDQGLALEALMANPLVGSYDKAKGYLERVLEADREYLPSFFS